MSKFIDLVLYVDNVDLVSNGVDSETESKMKMEEFQFTFTTLCVYLVKL